jgi:hypothetical protein
MVAANNAVLRVSELDFLTIRENLKTFLRSQSTFSDYDFDGSGLSVLLDLLAYNTHYAGYYLNMAANEYFLDTAQLRESVVSRAKHITYTPRSRVAAEAKVNIIVTPSGSESTSLDIITLDKYTKFLSGAVEGKNFPFVTIDSNTSNKVNGTFSFSNIAIKQGEVVTQQFLVEESNPKRRFVIPSANIDTTTMVVTVQESIANNYITAYSLNADITDLRANSPVYFLEETVSSNGMYVLQFGDNVLGKQPANGNIVIVTYLDTNGDLANRANSFTLTDEINGYSANIRVTSALAAHSGGPRETVDQIRFRAPRFYTIQNRAVTSRDFEPVLLRDYPNIEAVSVWSGDENDPPIYGKVFISLKAVDDYFITLEEKENIKNDIISKYSVMTVIPEFVDPDLTYLLMNIDVTYDPTLTALTAEQLKSLVRQTVIDYRDGDLKTFNSTFRKSKLQRLIDTTEKSITASSVKLYAQKRIEPDLLVERNYTMKFLMPLREGNFSQKLYTYPTVVVNDANLDDRNVYFEEVPDSSTGIDEISVVSTGSDYIIAPSVTITGDGSGANAYSLIVAGRVTSIVVDSQGSNYSAATIALTTDDEGSGATAVAKLQSKIGSLRTYYIKTNGEKVVVNDEAGTIDYETGEIVLVGFEPLELANNSAYLNTEFTVSIPPDEEIIYPVRNRILDIDANDPFAIQITMIPE